MRKLLALALLCFAPLLAHSQQDPNPLTLVMPQGDGAIRVTPGAEWKPGSLSLYDKGTRPVINLSGNKPGLNLSYILFPADYANVSPESCREDVIRPLLSQFGPQIDSKSIQRGELTTTDGKHLATAAYTLHMSSAEIAQAAGVDLKLDNLFGFYGEGKLCAEVHVSQTNTDKSSRIAPTDAPLKSLAVDAHYKPVLLDYAVLASIFYNSAKDYAAAGPYYEHALALVGPSSDPQQRNLTRLLTDQASMAYGISGDLKKSRALLEAAIAKDPDYPLYYYNLACADAESGDAKSAQQHLQQAFDRRANTLPGEKLPNPTTDDSILKLKKNKDFWAFVQTLPKS